jgi:flagellar biosynthesis protein FlhF
MVVFVKIRRYMGKDAQEAILKVKMDLGKEAIILNTKKVRQKGLMGLFAKPLVEVLAAVDDDQTKKKPEPQKEIKEEPKQMESKFDNSVLEKKDSKINELENKVNAIEGLLHRIYDQMQQGTQKEKQVVQEEDKLKGQPKVLQLFYNNLVKNEVDPELAKKIIDAASQKAGNNTSVNDSAAVLYSIITGILGKPETIKISTDGRPTIVIFVGPTGVGKTTTLAKIAANYALNHKKKVGFISADTYRIAAVEQLKTYAEILGIPMLVVYSATEIQDAIKQFSDKDIVLIDTAGRSHRNKTQFEELKTMISASNADEVFLVLSTTTSIRNCREILNNYDFIKDYKLVFTKLDETPITGLILNTRYLSGKSLSYMTNGQSVPDDIEIANTEKLAKNLLGSINT